MARWFRREEDQSPNEILYDAYWCHLTYQHKEASRLIRLCARKIGDEHVSSQLEEVKSNGQTQSSETPPTEKAV